MGNADLPAADRYLAQRGLLSEIDFPCCNKKEKEKLLGDKNQTQRHDQNWRLGNRSRQTDKISTAKTYCEYIVRPFTYNLFSSALAFIAIHAFDNQFFWKRRD